ncbi:DUF4231 domain-containing protein [Streptomyces sp. NPDC058583]|uniref:DUF4231 domain-containing protein n=1 Tax=unclassified Streptomyces TaxID=2593676 RepID=UPI00364ACEF4
MVDIQRRRRHRLRLLALGLVVTVAGLVTLQVLGHLDKDRAGLAVAVLGAVAAWAAWEATGRASDTAEAARRTAETLARIERARWLTEQTPQFDFVLTSEGDRGAKLRIHLAGPDSLGHLDSITVRIGDDFNHTSSLAGATPPKQIAAHVWGPFKLRPRISRADEHGRELTSGSLRVGRGLPLVFDRTVPGVWMAMNYDSWQQTYEGHPIRLTLVCRRGDDIWTVARAIDNPPWRANEPTTAGGAEPEPGTPAAEPRRLPAPRGSRARVRRAPDRRRSSGRSQG